MTEAPAPARSVRTPRLRRRWMRPRNEILLFALLTLAIRLAAWQLRPALLPDSVDLLGAAEEAAAGGGVLSANHHPLPVWALSWLQAWSPSGDPETASSILVAALAAIGIWPLHALTRSVSGRHSATIACLLYAVLPKFVLAGSVPLAEGIFLPLLLGAFAAAATAHVGRERWKRGVRLVAAGVLAGGAYLSRPEGLVAALAVPLLTLLQARRERRIVSFVIPLGAFVLVAAPWVVALSADRGTFTLSPKKDIARFAGLDAAPREQDGRGDDGGGGATASLTGAARALWDALGPGLLLVVLGALPRSRWGPRHRRVRLVLILTAAALFCLLLRLRAGWGYAGGRHALAASCLLLPFAGEGAMTVVGFISRAGRRRAAALVLTMLAAIPLGAYAILRPDGEGGEKERHLGRAIAEVAKREPGGDVLIASFREGLVPWYADRELRPERRARGMRLLRDHERLLSVSADLGTERAALARDLRARGAQWLVLDLYDRRARTGAPRAAGAELATRLIADGVLGTPVVASGSELAAFPVIAETGK